MSTAARKRPLAMGDVIRAHTDVPPSRRRTNRQSGGDTKWEESLESLENMPLLHRLTLISFTMEFDRENDFPVAGDELTVQYCE